MLIPKRVAATATATGFAVFVDRYLYCFARRHPSSAAGNGLHDHDDLLDDFSAQASATGITTLNR